MHGGEPCDGELLTPENKDSITTPVMKVSLNCQRLMVRVSSNQDELRSDSSCTLFAIGKSSNAFSLSSCKSEGKPLVGRVSNLS